MKEKLGFPKTIKLPKAIECRPLEVFTQGPTGIWIMRNILQTVKDRFERAQLALHKTFEVACTAVIAFGTLYSPLKGLCV